MIGRDPEDGAPDANDLPVTESRLAAAVPLVLSLTEITADDFPQVQGAALGILADACEVPWQEIQDAVLHRMMPVGFTMKALQLMALLAYRAGAFALVARAEAGGDPPRVDEDGRLDPAEIVAYLREIAEP